MLTYVTSMGQRQACYNVDVQTIAPYLELRLYEPLDWLYSVCSHPSKSMFPNLAQNFVPRPSSPNEITSGPARLHHFLVAKMSTLAKQKCCDVSLHYE